MPTINKKKLVDQICLQTGIAPDRVVIIVQEILNGIKENLSEGNRFEFRNFGIFEIVQRAQKVGRNPKEPHKVVIIPAKHAVKFTPGKVLKSLDIE